MTPDEMELRIKRLESQILNLHFTMRAPLEGICLNISLDDHPHPHYTWLPLDWSKDIIYLDGADDPDG